MIQFCSFVRCILLTLTFRVKYVNLWAMSIFLITDCRVFHLGKEELGTVLNSGAVLQRSALFHLKMHPGQCHLLNNSTRSQTGIDPAGAVVLFFSSKYGMRQCLPCVKGGGKNL